MIDLLMTMLITMAVVGAILGCFRTLFGNFPTTSSESEERLLRIRKKLIDRGETRAIGDFIKLRTFPISTKNKTPIDLSGISKCSNCRENVMKKEIFCPYCGSRLI